jgi:hypothetical protein
MIARLKALRGQARCAVEFEAKSRDKFCDLLEEIRYRDKM